MGYLSRITDALGGGSDGGGWTPAEVLVVEDESMVAQMYSDWLSDAGFDVEVANTGEEALRTVGGDVDVVLLDRRMPVIAGDEILDLLRSDDIHRMDPDAFKDRDEYRITQEYEGEGVEDVRLETLKKLDDTAVRNLQRENPDPWVCMVTAVDPDTDIVDMGFDHYVVKNVGEKRLVEIVDSLSSMSGIDEEVREYQSLRWKRFMLRESLTQDELDENDEYRELEERIEEIEEEGGEAVREISEVGFD